MTIKFNLILNINGYFKFELFYCLKFGHFELFAKKKILVDQPDNNQRSLKY